MGLSELILQKLSLAKLLHEQRCISLDKIQQSEDDYLSIAFTAVMGFIFFISYTSFMAKYLSLPLSVRESGLIFLFFLKVKLNYMICRGWLLILLQASLFF